jgi:hypothetical protein
MAGADIIYVNNLPSVLTPNTLYVKKSGTHAVIDLTDKQGQLYKLSSVRYQQVVNYNQPTVLIQTTLDGEGEKTSAFVGASGPGVVHMTVGSNSNEGAGCINIRLQYIPPGYTGTNRYFFSESRVFGAWNQTTHEFQCAKGIQFRFYCSTPTNLFCALTFYPYVLVEEE